MTPPRHRRAIARPHSWAALAAIPLLLGACLTTSPRSDAAVPCETGDEPLVISLGELEYPPGSENALRLYRAFAGFAFEPLAPSCVRWSVPPGAPARITADGLLTIIGEASDGATFGVRAVVGSRRAETVVRVVDPVASPLVGIWRQVGIIACELGGPPAAVDPIRELRLSRDGTFTVTWLPFEGYVDYHGRYEHDREDGSLRLDLLGGNFVPDHLTLEGVARVTTDTLRLDRIWLGSRAAHSNPACGLTFVRTSS